MVGGRRACGGAAVGCWLLVHPLHLAEDLALVHGQDGGVFQHLLEHGATLKLITGFLEVVPEEGGQTDRESVIRKRQV